MKTNIKKINMYVFGIVALLHLWRALSGAELVIGTLSIPPWGSVVGFLLAGCLSYLNYKS